MFTFSGRFRRRVAVLSVLSLLASVLVVAAPAAAADPKADYKATFSACVGAAAEDAGFTDVPSGHANAGDIDCIAYYGVTKGTSASTYSPLMSVTREQMALFLTRLARIVRIDVDDDPSDPGFTDTADLSAESQTAIAQLAALGITQGTSATTYAPADTVQRGHMALFIARLMNQMTPQADGEIGLGSTTQFGYVPSDVDGNDMDADIGSPFTDLSQATKEEWDAITNLYELGVAAGITDTSYSPVSDITRASMAGFMAAVLDHSNARPAGLTIQSDVAEGWGDQDPTILVSVRDDEFAAVEDRPVDMFSSTSSNEGIRKDGTCNFGTNPDDVYRGDFIDGDCVWNDNDPATDVNGNVVTEREVREGRTRVFHAWIGGADDQKYDRDVDAGVKTSVAARYAQNELVPGSTINKHAHDAGDGQQVDLGVGRSVIASAQLIDVNDNHVERPGISIRVEYRQGVESVTDTRNPGFYVDSHQAVEVTDETGSVSIEVSPPADNRRIHTQQRKDVVIFTELDANGADITERAATLEIHWIEEEPTLTSDSLTKPVYVLAGSPAIDVRVHLWDQYGNPYRSHSSQKVQIEYADDESGDEADEDPGPEVRQVISRGYARWTAQVKVADNQQVTVTYDVRQLARNSRGEPVKKDAGANPASEASEIVADYAAWLALGASQSDATRQAAIDDLDVTYNDGSVIVDGDTDDDNDIDDQDTGATSPIYQAHRNDGTTDVINDDANEDDLDPVLVYTSTADTDSTDGLVPLLRSILNEHALDTYVDRGPGPGAANTAPTAGRTDHENNMDAGNVVYVVEKASSRDVGSDVLSITHVLAGSDSFLTDSLADADTDTKPELVYVYNDDDIFIDSTDVSEGIEISMATFETMITRSENKVTHVEVIAYDIDGTSIFRLRSGS